MTDYICQIHGAVKPLLRNTGKAVVRTCPICRKEASRASHLRTRMPVSQMRPLAIKKYGGICVCCGEMTPEFLVIDHKSGGGTKERRSMTNQQFWRKLLTGDVRSDLQVLCANCNMAKERPEGCPHQRSILRQAI